MHDVMLKIPVCRLSVAFINGAVAGHVAKQFYKAPALFLIAFVVIAPVNHPSHTMVVDDSLYIGAVF